MTQSGGNLARLARWWPLQLLIVALVCSTSWVSWRARMFAAHAAPHGIAVDMSGAEGAIADGMLTLSLPVAVYNSAASPVRQVSLWVDVLACPARSSPSGDCRKVLGTRQEVATRIENGGQSHGDQHMSVAVGPGLDGADVRIHRELDAVVTQDDLSHKSPLD